MPLSSERILITSTQFPYYGGAATNAYAMHTYFRRKGMNSALLFFGNHPPGTNYDPENTGRVFHLTAGNSTDKIRIREKIQAALGANPDIILAKNYVAPVESKILFPGSQVIYLVSGSPFLTVLAEQNISAMQFLHTGLQQPAANPAENRCIGYADRIVANSPLAAEIFSKIYSTSKLHPVALNTSSVINYAPADVAEDVWHERRYDLGFVCSRMSRKIKNAGFARKLFTSGRLEPLRKIAIGAESEFFSGCADYKELLPQPQVRELLTQVKTLVCTSYFDASPNILREAVAAGCNIVLSRNCGWSELYPAGTVCDDVYNEDGWIETITRSLDEKKTISNSIHFDPDYVFGKLITPGLQ